MTTTIQEDGNQLIATLAGRLDTAAAVATAEAVKPLLEAQGIEGENITASKKQIESIMDTLIQGFEKQLDMLFSAQAMDINSDIDVLENMMAADGLKESDFTMKRSGGH